MKLVLLAAALPLLAAMAQTPRPSPAVRATPTTVTRSSFGKLPDGSEVELYTLGQRKLRVRIMTFGAHIVSISAPDRGGKAGEVVLGFDTLAGYLPDKKTYMGAVVGRYGNRIAHGRFALDGKTYTLTTNNNGNTLHGGTEGFDRRNWTARPITNGVELTLVSPAGDQGFPGELTAHVRYTLAGDQLRMDYSASTSAPTIVNLTNHSYFNLAGAGDTLGQTLQINADRIVAADAGLIPTGVLLPVDGTPFDFRQPTAIGARIDADDPQLRFAGGYDHTWVFPAGHTLAQPAAVLTDPASGRTLRVFTTEPGVQFYAGNSLDGTLTGRNGLVYAKHAGLCLETQHFPDSPNHPAFPSTTLRPGKPFESTTIFEFTAK